MELYQNLLLVLRALNKCPPKNPVYPEINILKFQYPLISGSVEEGFSYHQYLVYWYY